MTAAEKPIVVDMEPDKIRLTPIQSALIDQLVEARQARTGQDAHHARRDIVGEVLLVGLREVQATEGA